MSRFVVCMAKGPEGVAETWVMVIVISVLAPPAVWIIGKVMIG